MIPASISWQRTPSRRLMRVALLAVMCVAWRPGTLAAGQESAEPEMFDVRCSMFDVRCAVSDAKTSHIEQRTSNFGFLFANFFNDIMGNRTRMIQIGFVVLAIGILLLRQQYR
jgi:hypothetical protein